MITCISTYTILYYSIAYKYTNTQMISLFIFVMLLTFSIVAMYTAFFLSLFLGGILPRLPAYSSTAKSSASANSSNSRTFNKSSEIKTNSISNLKIQAYLIHHKYMHM